jgi:CRP-like cAMP-binding protein
LFPLSGLVSIISGTVEGNNIQVGIVGREGAIGMSPDAQSHTSGTVLAGGSFIGLPAQRFWSIATANPELLDIVRSTIEWLLLQAQRNASCNAIHDAEKRLSRWLLHVADRAGREIQSTQEEIAQALGLRRTTLTLIAHKLQTEGLISYKRGMIVIRDRARLEALTCDCYRSQPALTWTAERIAGQRSGGAHNHAADVADPA